MARPHRSSLGLPNLVYQLTHDLPQLRMGQALADNNAGDVRVAMWVLLARAARPAAGGDLGRRAARALARPRGVRFFVVVFVVVVLFTFVSGAQPHYPVFILPIPFAAGMWSRWSDTSAGSGAACSRSTARCRWSSGCR